MSLDKFDDHCPSCRPLMLDMQTGQPLPDGHPLLAIVDEVWKEMSISERAAFHRFTCLNKRTPEEIAVMETFGARITDRYEASTKVLS
jgi:hypothetical protein